jgi:sorbitol-specific phosphotransferase system component IIBC
VSPKTANNLPARVATAIGMVLAVAIGTKIAWQMLAPLVPELIVLFILAVIYGLAFSRFHR